MSKIIIVFMLAGLCLTACSNTMMTRSAVAKPDKLKIYADGKMIFKHRPIPVSDVIIFSDGLGGEKAAIKMYPPFHPPFYRGSIIVERMNTGS